MTVNGKHRCCSKLSISERGRVVYLWYIG